MTPEQTRQIARMELAATVGGTFGVASILLLRAAGKKGLADGLTFCGILAGGVFGLIRLAARYPDA